MTDITDFFNQHYPYIWDTTALHRKGSVAKMQVFFDFAGNADRRLDEIRGADIIDFCRYLKETRCISDNTINHYRSALSRFFNYAQDYLDLPKIPNIKFVKVKNQRVRFFSRSEIKQIKEYLGNHQHAWLLPMFNIGISQYVVLINYVRHVRLTHTKNGDCRDVSLSDDVLNAFEALNWNAETMFIEGAHY